MSYLPPTVNYLDDDDDDRAILQEVLKEVDGIHLIAVASETDLMHHLEVSPVSLVLLDIHIPGTSGLKVLSRLRENDATCHLPVISMSTGRREHEVSFAEGYGGYFIAKPATINGFQEIVSLVKTLLRADYKAGRSENRSPTT
jgi:DNA-binding response OmpR family regulator